MKNYIFITTEGYTFQPESDFIEQEIENCQVLGFGVGNDSKEAFLNFQNEYSYIKQTSFNEVICYELESQSSVTNFALKS